MENLENNNMEFSFLSANPNDSIREVVEEEHSFRTKFERDSDRILFSKEFRRLQGKTQVFVAGFDDHTRNRLTHTLIVSQIAQGISKYFGFNEALSKAISYGHDIGHTPFGHVGERTLNLITNNCDVFDGFDISENEMGFKHNWQGLKVVSSLELISPDYKGLNLTDYTLWGILNHSNIEVKECEYLKDEDCYYKHEIKKCKNLMRPNGHSINYYEKYKKTLRPESWSFEALIVRIADEIAQRYHDVEDGLLAGIIDKEELINKISITFGTELNDTEKEILEKIKKTEIINSVLHDLSGFIIRFYSTKLIKNSEEQLKKMIGQYSITGPEDFFDKKSSIKDIFTIINYDKEFNDMDKIFQAYLYTRILNSHITQTMDGKSTYILRNIFQALLTNPKQLSDATISTFFSNYYGKEEFTKLIEKKSPKEISGLLSLNNSQTQIK
jgi:dGTPase